MIYTTVSRLIVTRNYGVFCSTMHIPSGSGSARNRTPAEARTVAQFLLAVNTGREAVFINLNLGLAVLVGEEVVRESYYKKGSLPSGLARTVKHRSITTITAVSKASPYVPKVDYSAEDVSSIDTMALGRYLRARIFNS